MRKTLAGVLAVAALAVPAAAGAGGWATVGLAPLPDGMAAGELWVVNLTVLQHGRTPLAGVRPQVILTSSNGQRLTYVAGPTAKVGVYQARITLPEAGSWTIRAYDGFTQYGGAQTHGFGTVAIAAPPGGGSFPLWPVLGGVLGAFALGGLAWLMLRLRARAVPAAAR